MFLNLEAILRDVNIYLEGSNFLDILSRSFGNIYPIAILTSPPQKSQNRFT